MPNRRNSIYALLIICLLAGLFTGRGVFFNISYLLGALLVLSLIWSWTTINWVSINRQTRTRRTQVGRTLEEAFTVRNTALFPKIWLEVRDHSDVPGHHASFVVPALRPFGAYRWNAGTVCSVRGEFTLGPMTLISGDPFGLFQSTRHLPATSKILVYPPTVPMSYFAAPVGLLSGGDAQRQRTHFVTTNAAGVREYAPGDSFNRIHWRSSARKAQLLVKEFELDPLADIWMFLDISAQSLSERPFTREGTPGEWFLPPSTGEYAIVVAASIAQYFLVKERAFGFATYNPVRCIFQPDRGNRQLTKILETLAMARFESEITCEQLMALEGHHMSRGTTIIIVTADPTDGWLREANLLVRRGLRTIAVIFDPHSFGNTEVRSGNDTRILLEAAGVITYLIRQGDDLSAVLSQRRTLR
ncbi:MAG: DUF58 domain-containing protein [Anaerolineae bacterium]|nr:DUF58 domain-containing protein [Anaerolineae bacterium]